MEHNLHPPTQWKPEGPSASEIRPLCGQALHYQSIHPQTPPQRILLPLLVQVLIMATPRPSAKTLVQAEPALSHSLQSGPPQVWLNGVRDIDLCRFAKVSVMIFGCWRSQSPLILRVLAVLFPWVNQTGWLIFLFTAQFSQQVPKQPVRLLHELAAPQKPTFM